MGGFLLRRFLLMVPTLALVSVLVFGLQQLLPGDPALMLAGDEANPTLIAEVRAKYHLDDPAPLRYLRWVGGLASGDLGESLRTRQPVVALLAQKLPVTIELATLTMLIAIALGIPLGIVAAVWRGRLPDVVARVVSLCGISTPSFSLGILLILLFSVNLGWLPASGYVPFFDDPIENLRTMILPAFTLGAAVGAVLMRHTRGAMLGVLGSDYVRIARAKGLREPTVVLKHALRNAFVPIITLGALEFGQLLSGTVMTETVFSIPGFGKLVVDAVFNRDYAVVQGVVLCTAIAFLLLNLFADIGYALANPRLRH